MTQKIIIDLGLGPHPEGGYFKEVYRSSKKISTEQGERSLATSIYYYLESMDFSSWHRLKSDELWHYYSGDGLTIHKIDPEGKLTHVRLGDLSVDSGKEAQTIIPAGTWFAAEVDCVHSYILVGCTVFPGFDYADFELAKMEELIALFPQHEAIIRRLSRNRA
jgi:uncharacterized protein